MVPLVYLLLAVFDVQRAAFGVTEAARQAGRAYARARRPGDRARAGPQGQRPGAGRPGAGRRREPEVSDPDGLAPGARVSVTVRWTVVAAGARPAARPTSAAIPVRPPTSRSSTPSGPPRDARATRARCCCSCSGCSRSCWCWSGWSSTSARSCSPSARSPAPPTARRCRPRRRWTSGAFYAGGVAGGVPLSEAGVQERVAAYAGAARQPGLELSAAVEGGHTAVVTASRTVACRSAAGSGSAASSSPPPPGPAPRWRLPEPTCHRALRAGATPCSRSSAPADGSRRYAGDVHQPPWPERRPA